MKPNISGKSICCAAALAAGLAISPAPAAAHPPESVALAYDPAARQLSVTITHKTSLPNWHYIKKVRITKNGQGFSLDKYPSQPTKDTFTYTYPVDAAAGDLLEAKATCSIMGSRSAGLTVAALAGR